VKRTTTIITGLLVLATPILAASSGHSGTAGHGAAAQNFIWLAIILIAAKLSAMVQRWGQPAVLGELTIGVILGNLGLVGIHALDPIGTNTIVEFLSELGVVILLFQIGLESNIKEMLQTGARAMFVAIAGIIIPFVTGTWLIGPWLLPELSFNAHLFLGATLTATSVGITARVFQDLNKLDIREANIVLGAAVIDDILGLVILAVVSALVTAGTVSAASVAWILAKAFLFLGGSIVLGQLIAPYLGRGLAKVHTGIGMKFTLAISFCLIFAFLADLIGLAAIVGAFAAGLVLDAVHFQYFKNPKVLDDIREHVDEEHPSHAKVEEIIEHYEEAHVEDLIDPIALFLVPIFFVYTGFAVDLSTLFNLQTLVVSIAITVIAILGKWVAGFLAGDVNKSLVGWGMVPRGEVGLIFASIGRELGVVNDQVFSIIVIVVILTTLVAPPVLNYYLRDT
jgi:Kef-type K+ transport system membrane component KefB